MCADWYDGGDSPMSKSWYTMFVGPAWAVFNHWNYNNSIDEIIREEPDHQKEYTLRFKPEKCKAFMMYTLITMKNRNRVNFGIKGARSIEDAKDNREYAIGNRLRWDDDAV